MQDEKQKSTGPVTPEGKARSSQNATKHGLRSRTLILNETEQTEFDQLHKELQSEISPAGPVETFAFEQLVRAAWNLRRVERKIAELGGAGADPFDDPESFKKFELFERYHQRAEGSYYRAQRELRALQTNRVLQQALPEPIDQTTLPALANVQQIVQLAKRTHRFWPAMAINTLVDRSAHPVPQEDPKQRKPISFMDLLTDKERSQFEPKPPKSA